LSRVDWLSKAKKLDDFNKTYHAVIITNYRESIRKVNHTLEYLANQDFPKKRIFIVLAMEEREGNQAKIRAKQLISSFKNKFAGIYATFHPDLPGEVKGKASNSTWAAKFIKKELNKLKIDTNFVTITSCDADSLLPVKYFSYLS
jgi:cellulose synthase/poly-beta-1,6-N-acetylglucosamine synthase-like glycosyltransferase